MKKIINIIFSLCFSILIIIGVIKFTVGFKPLYYYDVDELNIVELTNISKEDIKLNYDYLIEYITSKKENDFEMPTLTSSKEGKIHFEEVREIYQNVNKIFNVCLIISVLGIVYNIRNKNIRFLNLTSILLIIMPVALAIPIVIDFDSSFVVFHKLLFDNDYWIFDPILDPVIKILPAEFFMNSGLMILGLILASSIIIQGIYRLLKRKREQ
ncbi:TIGR01906 family membrane protein [Romboutsia sp. 1001216sp1]|uniref:TIGR01906 family membrane protein n=1 Tax=unclassified Romboutsia TaxID=2626894 RepID=UPI00189E6EC9|nr:MULTISPECIES: TIGR01906 family membrane protein [unclassified Romboutsia]MDB8789592.1 TIGR01906 family membrane protein [Romboutsia sp. 1001216sp1]MDB8802735.1 TIGR01906 family membrane protein [Romboutsia sp. 1001216sp1]MDB8814132.1 TIGR01906 family membrane protein [Romboutsia sp. 1001216sp1]